MLSEIIENLVPVLVIFVIGKTIIGIIKAGKASGGGKKIQQEMKTLGDSMRLMEDELDEARQRIEVLEKIVTDEKHQLNSDINNLRQG